MEDLNYRRARALLGRERYDLAEPHLRRALADNPDNGRLHAVLAFCLMKQGRLDEALSSVREAIRRIPGDSFPHFLHAELLNECWRTDEARAAIEEALRIDPAAADSHGLLGAIDVGARRWESTLRAAERGLRLDPENARCKNVRAVALNHLGRPEEATATLESILEHDPENAQGHVALGWDLMQEGDRREALAHFREAMRMEPTPEGARRGIVECRKGAHPLYRCAAGYVRWLWRHTPRQLAAIFITQAVLVSVLAGVRNRCPRYPFSMSLVLYLAMLWALMPLIVLEFCNPLLIPDREAWGLLSPRQKAGTYCLLCLLAAAAGTLALEHALFGRGGLASLGLAFLSIPLMAVFGFLRGTSSRAALWLLGGVVLVALAVDLLPACHAAFGFTREEAIGRGDRFIHAFTLGVFPGTIVAMMIGVGWMKRESVRGELPL